MDTLNHSIAILLIRLVCGILFFAQAYEKIFKVKLKNVVEAFGVQLQQQVVSKQLFTWAIYLSSYAELVAGTLLALGLFRSIALYIIAGDLLMVGIVFSIIKPMWDTQFYFPRLILVLMLLLLPTEWDAWCLDHLIGH